jgi:ATP adenylyltransferase/5',5'''-P-1,P-4-tetraphosphate phosphorylase II
MFSNLLRYAHTKTFKTQLLFTKIMAGKSTNRQVDLSIKLGMIPEHLLMSKLDFEHIISFLTMTEIKLSFCSITILNGLINIHIISGISDQNFHTDAVVIQKFSLKVVMEGPYS